MYMWVTFRIAQENINDAPPLSGRALIAILFCVALHVWNSVDVSVKIIAYDFCHIKLYH